MTIEEALDSFLTPEQMRVLIDNVLSITKKGQGHCRKCGTNMYVEVFDSRAVVGALNDLLVQAKGRPGVAEGSAEERSLVFTNRVVLVGEEG